MDIEQGKYFGVGGAFQNNFLVGVFSLTLVQTPPAHRPPPPGSLAQVTHAVINLNKLMEVTARS